MRLLRINSHKWGLVEAPIFLLLEFGIPIVNKRVSITPAAIVGSGICKTPDDFVKLARMLNKVAHDIGVNFLGGFSAIVSKGMTTADELLIRSLPQALATTELVCSSVNVGSTKTGINMDAVRLVGQTVKASTLTRNLNFPKCRRKRKS